MNFPPPTPFQARVIWMSLTAFAIIVFLAVLGVLIWGAGVVLRELSPVVWPLALAGVLAYLLDPVVDFFERKRVPRRRAILLVFLAAIGVTGGVLASVVPRLVYEASDLVADVPQYTRTIQGKANEWLTNSPVRFRFPFRLGGETSSTNSNNTVTTNSVAEPGVPPSRPDAPPAPGWEKRVTESAIAWVTETLPKVGKWLLSQLSHVASWLGMLVGLAMVPVFTFYFLDEKRGIQAGWQKYLPVQESKLKEEIVFVLSAINDYLIAFFRGQIVVAASIGVMLTIGFSLIGLNYALLLGVMAGVLSIVPYLGAILTIVPAVILAAVQFRDWLHPLLVIGIFALAQMAEGLVISPKVMGDRVGLHPLTVIVAVLVGTTLLGGILGGVLAIPLTAAARVVMFRYVWKKRA